MSDNTKKEMESQLILKEKMASMGRLLAGIAHEIKNPLNFIYGNIDFLQEYIEKIENYIKFLEEKLPESEFQKKKEELNLDEIVEDFKDILVEINEGAERIKNLVDDLKVFSRKPSEKIIVVDIHKVIDMALNLLRNKYKRRIKIVRNYCENGEVEVMLGKIEEVFLNILSNSIDAISGEGEIKITTKRDEKNMVIEISDTGSGISEDIREKIFDPFFTTKDVGEGTGLGLSISYKIIKSHGGEIEVESEIGKGTTFRVTLPLKRKKIE